MLALKVLCIFWQFLGFSCAGSLSVNAEVAIFFGTNSRFLLHGSSDNQSGIVSLWILICWWHLRQVWTSAELETIVPSLHCCFRDRPTINININLPYRKRTFLLSTSLTAATPKDCYIPNNKCPLNFGPEFKLKSIFSVQGSYKQGRQAGRANVLPKFWV